MTGWRLFAAIILGCAGPAFASSPHYDVRLDLNPAKSSLAARATLRGLPCDGTVLRLHLNRALTITGVTVDGRAATPMFEPLNAERFWLSAARTFDIPCPSRVAVVAYGGDGAALTPDGRNQVSADLVELSLYGGWFPIARLEQQFTWRLRTALPATMRFASNGRVTARASGARVALDIRRDSPADIVLVASPHFIDRTVTRDGVTTRVLVGDDRPPADLARADGIGRDAAATTAWLTALLGPPQSGTTAPTLVFTRRGGPLSYARLPLIVTPAAALGRGDPDRPLDLNTRHEVAHFWSRANGAVDDWINEGFAEYLAVRRTGDVDGAPARAAIVAGYRITAADSGVSILDTARDGAREYVNRYVRPTLLLDRIEAVAGRPATDAFLRAVFASGQTSAAVESAAAATLGATLADDLHTCLRATDWPARCGGAATPRSHNP